MRLLLTRIVEGASAQWLIPEEARNHRSLSASFVYIVRQLLVEGDITSMEEEKQTFQEKAMQQARVRSPQALTEETPTKRFWEVRLFKGRMTELLAR